MTPATRAALDLYVRQGVRPGSFLVAVLENDLSAAVLRADPENLSALQEIVRYVYHELPEDAWGNRNRVATWMARQRAIAKKGREA